MYWSSVFPSTPLLKNQFIALIMHQCTKSALGAMTRLQYTWVGIFISKFNVKIPTLDLLYLVPQTDTNSL